MFYESRLPNDGRDIKPVYEGSVRVLSLNGTTTTLLDESIQNKPASTPIEKEMPGNPFEYSLISDTSMEEQETIKLDESAQDDFLMLDETAVLVDEAEKEGQALEDGKIQKTPNVPRGERQGQKQGLDCTLEDGEIIDVEGNMDDSVVFVSEEILTPKRKREVVSGWSSYREGVEC